jgi:adenosine kinase
LSIVVTGSLAYDYLMSFPGCFKDHILAESIEVLSVSFLVDSMRKQRGGCASNIAYSLALLGECPTIMATAGQDFSDYRTWLDAKGIDTSGIVEIEDEFTASFFVSTDLDNNQIASFYTGAMAKAHTLSYRDLKCESIDVTIISPNDPRAMGQYAEECKALGIPYIYDPSQQIIRLSGEELLAGARGSRMLIVNEYEFDMMKKKTELDDAGLRALTEILIVTKGENGSSIMVGDDCYDIPIVPASRVADPTGVGDAYRSGIIKGLIHSLPWQIAGQMASLAATYVIEHDGTQNHHYTLGEFAARYHGEFGPSAELDTVLLATR